MKTKFLSLCFAALAVVGSRAEEKKACCAACCVAEQSASATNVATPLPARSLYQLDATWTDDKGDSVSLASLRGQPVVLAMFFASCEYACPILVNDMKQMRDALPADVRDRARFVLISFDSARDTSAVLHAYRERADLDSRWTLLRGNPDDVRMLAMLVGVKYKQDARGQFSHSNLITILNPSGEIVYQRSGLQGDVSEAARALVAVAK